MSGPNKRPAFYSKEEAVFFERTPKHVLFRLLRDFAIQHVHDTGYVDKWHEDPSKWISKAKERFDIAV